MTWWWLSFCDDARAVGARLLGVALVQARSMVEATMVALSLAYALLAVAIGGLGSLGYESDRRRARAAVLTGLLWPAAVVVVLVIGFAESTALTWRRLVRRTLPVAQVVDELAARRRRLLRRRA